jgi:N-acetylneuraminic acid mutarotase
MPEELNTISTRDQFTKGLATLLLPALALWMSACSSDQAPTEPQIRGGETPAAATLALTSNTWTARAPLPFGPCEVAAGLVDAAGKSTVYVLGGTVCNEGGDLALVWAYDVTGDTWTRKNAQYSTTSPNGLGKIGNKFYVTGGSTFGGGGGELARATTEAYDFTNDRFIQKADMPKATGEGVTGVIHDKLYVLPGFCSGEGPLFCDVEPIRQLYRYDPVTNTWATRRSAPHYHRGGAGGVINDKFYVVGGKKDCCLSAASLDVASLDVYDPATNTWTTLAPMPTAGPVIGAVLRGRLYVIRGPTGELADTGAGALYVYDPVTNIWKTKRGPTWSHAAATRVMIDGIAYLLAVGGTHGSGFDETPNPSELYTP